jgi:hypothetical protein
MNVCTYLFIDRDYVCSQRLLVDFWPVLYVLMLFEVVWS